MVGKRGKLVASLKREVAKVAKEEGEQLPGVLEAYVRLVSRRMAPRFLQLPFDSCGGFIPQLQQQGGVDDLRSAKQGTSILRYSAVGPIHVRDSDG